MQSYFFARAESKSIREVCQSLEQTLIEGAGTQRDAAGKESLN
jgi:hypothetical protein